MLLSKELYRFVRQTMARREALEAIGGPERLRAPRKRRSERDADWAIREIYDEALFERLR